MGPVPTVPLPPGPTAVLVAAVVVAIVVCVGTRYRLGPDADVVEALRSVALPPLDGPMERLFGGEGSVYTIGEREFVTTVGDVDQFKHILWDEGFRRNLLSATKRAPDGTEQVSAWVLRDPAVVGERMQVDVMLFADGRVAAHHEPSSSFWWLFRDYTVLRKHYNGVGYDPAEGERILRAQITGGRGA